MDFLGPILGAATSLFGGAMSAGAASDGAEAQIQAGRESRAFDTSRLNEGMVRQLAVIFGPEQAMKLLQGTIPKEQFEAMFGGGDPRKSLQDVDNQLAEVNAKLKTKGLSKTERDYLTSTRQQLTSKRTQTITDIRKGTNNAGQIDKEAFMNMGPGVMSEYNTLADKGEAEGRDLLAGFKGDTDTLMRGYNAMGGEISRYGKQQEARVNRDVDRSLAGANRSAQGILASRGFGNSTAVTDAMRGNMQAAEETRADALGRIGDTRIGMLNSLGSERLGALGSRMGGGTSLLAGFQDRNMGLRRGALDLKTNVLTNSTMQPWANRSGTAYNPGVSPSAAAGATWGNAAGAVGGTLLGGWMQGRASRGNPQPNNDAQFRGMQSPYE